MTAQIRGMVPRYVLEHLPDGAAAAAVARAEARIGAPAVAHLKDAGRMEWVDFSHYAALAQALLDVMGETTMRVFFRGMSGEMLQQPLLQNMVKSAVTLFGLSPGKMTRFVVPAMELFMRDVGHMTAGSDETRREAWLQADGVPPEAVASPGYPLAMAGGLESYFDVCRVHGRIDVERRDEAARVIRWRLTWA